jgi:2'-5' RNA ligase
MGIRLFLAVWLSPELQDKTVSLIQQLKRSSFGIKWSPKEQLHFTLKFLGEQSPDLLARIHPHLQAIAETTPAFKLTLGAGGLFPPRGEPRVLWVGLQDGVVALSHLAAAVDEACAKWGIAKEDRPFKAHLTIGRAKASPVQFDAELLHRGVEGTMYVPCFALVESRLSPSGPAYRTLQEYRLKDL